MKDYLFDFATRLFAIDSPTGFTHHAIDMIEQEVKALNFNCTRTNKGNLWIHVKGKSSDKHVGLCAHCDTLGLMVRSIKGDGKLALTTIGGILTPTLDGEYCTIYTRDGKKYTGTILSTSPAVHVFEDAASKTRDINNLEVRLDEVVSNAEDVKKLGINNGDFVCVDPRFVITDSGFIKTRFLDDKISVAIFMTLLKKFKDKELVPAYDTTFLISTYEEVGHGSSFIPAGISELLAVDMGCIGLDLACDERSVSICAKDSTGPYDYHFTSALINYAKELDLSYAIDIYPRYGSDVSAARSAGYDIKGALIGPGVHASHGCERTHIDGVMAAFYLCEAYLLRGI